MLLMLPPGGQSSSSAYALIARCQRLSFFWDVLNDTLTLEVLLLPGAYWLTLSIHPSWAGTRFSSPLRPTMVLGKNNIGITVGAKPMFVHHQAGMLFRLKLASLNGNTELRFPINAGCLATCKCLCMSFPQFERRSTCRTSFDRSMS